MKYLIWGTGRRAEWAYEFFCRLDILKNIEVIAFIDSNESKQGMKFKDKPIISPKQILDYEYDYISIESTFYDEVLDSLEKLSIPKHRVRDIMQDYWNDIESGVIEPKNQRYFLSLVTIVRNFAKDVVEWVEYHKFMGVQHIYLYDNESTDNIKEVIDKYIKEGYITYIWYPGEGVHFAAYNHAIKNYKNETKWMAFLDDDEFIVTKQNENICNVISEIVSQNEKKVGNKYNSKIGGIGTQWRMFGTSGHKKRPDGMVTQNYCWRAEDSNISNTHIKTICNPYAVHGFKYFSHAAEYKEGYCCINENGTKIQGAVCKENIADKLRIHHYYSKSEEDMIKKLERGWADQKHRKMSDEEIRQWINSLKEFNCIYDDRIKNIMI